MKRSPHFTLELLRGGPPHNQLVSPITEYLALCGDAAPFTLRLPFEHRDLTNCLLMLRYNSSIAVDAESFRQSELTRLARQLGNLLGSIPAFGAEMSSIDPHGSGEVVHLRLVLAGNELSLVPWEVAQVPDGLPGAGLPLFLQPRVPISITREARGASRRQFQWDRVPRVLFATADAGDFPPNTIEAHLLALRRALEPWTYQNWWKNGWQRDPYPIDIIEHASVAEIRRKCLEHDYTHVYILAHGVRIGSDDESRFGLYLHQSGNPSIREVATGEQLAHALLPSRSNRGASDPMMVTLSTCDSANQVEVVSPGGSVAHSLHHMGVPWVVASQFPLTVTGSVILVEELCSEIFQGTDPRMAVHRVRQHLSTRFGDRHDWATVVAYASFPYDFDYQINQFRQRAIGEKRNRAFALVDQTVLSRIREEKTETPPLGEIYDAVLELVKTTESEEVIKGASEGNVTARVMRASYWASRAATRKRLAEVQYLMGKRDEEWIQTLRKVFEDYKKGLQQGIQVDHWILVQYFVLRLVAGPGKKQFSPREKILFNQALQSIEMDLLSESPDDRMWARASQADLLMVALADPENIDASDIKAINVKDVLQEMVEDSGYDYTCPAIWPTFRQFWRWHQWWKISGCDEAGELGYNYLYMLIDRRLGESKVSREFSGNSAISEKIEDKAKIHDEGLSCSLKSKALKLKESSIEREPKEDTDDEGL